MTVRVKKVVRAVDLGRACHHAAGIKIIALAVDRAPACSGVRTVRREIKPVLSVVDPSAVAFPQQRPRAGCVELIIIVLQSYHAVPGHPAVRVEEIIADAIILVPAQMRVTAVLKQIPVPVSILIPACQPCPVVVFIPHPGLVMLPLTCISRRCEHDRKQQRPRQYCALPHNISTSDLLILSLLYVFCGNSKYHSYFNASFLHSQLYFGKMFRKTVAILRQKKKSPRTGDSNIGSFQRFRSVVQIMSGNRQIVGLRVLPNGRNDL